MIELQMNTDEYRSNEITEKIIRYVYVVANTLGNGFLEKVYENALAHELRKSGFFIEQQKGIRVRYDGMVVGDYKADLLVQKEVLVELKAVKTLDNIHIAQCLNYLKATGFKVCLLLNFATSKVQIRRLMN
jgi:GxxExxY protein